LPKNEKDHLKLKINLKKILNDAYLNLEIIQ